MKIISHRGNLNGPNEELENRLDKIEKAIESGFDVEIDIWYLENQLFLGHSKPEYKIEKEILQTYKEKLWIHCKNLDSMRLLENEDGLNFFWHENDKFTLTSKNFIWAYPDMYDNENIISVMPELVIDKLTIKKYIKQKKWIGICTDYPTIYK
tara:strand:- start:441 stop:899 length:459 start_codon:yes stop_codon:yes gene_type:complete